VGNYPGVTVEKVSSVLQIGKQAVECTDVPGLYSLNPVSSDEEVAVDVIFGQGYGARKPDLLVCVVSASNLERNLFFVSQLAEAGFPMVVALTMSDILESQGESIDVPRLSNLLGVDVVEVIGHKSRGIADLKDAIERNLETPRVPTREFGFPPTLEMKVAALRERLARVGLDFTNNEIRTALLERDTPVEQGIKDRPELYESFDQARNELIEEGVDPSIEVSTRYQWSAMVAKAAVRSSGQPVSKRSLSDKIDYVLTHRVFGLIIFVGVMYLTFQSIYTLAKPLMDGLSAMFAWIGNVVGAQLTGIPVLKSLLVDGLITGVGTVLTFLPQILILFFFVAVLEGTGYLARAAFLMDRLLGWCGLNGRAFIPLLSSFACAIPGIMAARVMPDTKSRLATILVAPLMSCSARLPVYLLLIGAFIEPRFGKGWAGFSLFAMHLLGLIVAIPIVFILNRGIIKGKRLPFHLELPPYQMPKWRDVWISMYFRAKVFVTTAGTIIVYMSIIIWALCYFPRSNEATARYQKEYAAAHVSQKFTASDANKYVQEQELAHSYLGRFGKTIEPVFKPAGFDWRITTSILSAFPARETVVPSLGIIFSLGGDQEHDSAGLRNAISDAKWPDGKPLMTPWTAVGLMVFFALCAQCMATLATVKRETNSWKWPVFMFCYMTILAYLAAVGINQLSKFFS
jgi:ferrous iron transport protein B